MIIRKAACAVVLIAFSSPLHAQVASSLSISQHHQGSRASAEAVDENSLFGLGAAATLIGAAVLGLIVWQIIENLDGNDDEPASP